MSSERKVKENFTHLALTGVVVIDVTEKRRATRKMGAFELIDCARPSGMGRKLQVARRRKSVAATAGAPLKQRVTWAPAGALQPITVARSHVTGLCLTGLAFSLTLAWRPQASAQYVTCQNVADVQMRIRKHIAG